ncbi:unnamed protein product [Rotaria sordida]|uniref:F-box domain-containing protein n=1 Tax=Rotaria sordida TaxID=392033 RepID=A0A814WDQ5_9BILA|nr:unnamed protein product [Rotaria sordida]
MSTERNSATKLQTTPLTYLILADHIIQQHINLKYLKLNLYGYWTLEKLDSFFAYIPNIKIFNLSSSFVFYNRSYLIIVILYNWIIYLSNMSTRLESLPNELLIDIFIYFDILNLYNSFWGLNRRFNKLVCSLKNISLIIKENNFLSIELFAHQIIRLKIETSQSIDLSQFINLNSLELCRANQNQLEQIRSDIMPNLIYLTISTPFHISLPLELIKEIFSNGFRFLHYAYLSRLDTFENFSKFQSFSLRTLYITCTNSNIIPLILQACPNLISFHIKFFGQNRHILPPSSSTYNHLLEEFFLDDPYHKLSFDTIHILFRFIPNVKYLFLQFLCRVPFINLIESILNRLEQLNRFECDILESPNNHMVNIEIIQQMNECFQYLQCSEKDNGYRVFFTE